MMPLISLIVCPNHSAIYEANPEFASEKLAFRYPNEYLEDLMLKLNVSGVDLPFVYDTVDVLSGKSMPTGKAVVIGGGLVGLEVAETLAKITYKIKNREGQNLTIPCDTVVLAMGLKSENTPCKRAGG